jgi:hypothetical protein
MKWGDDYNTALAEAMERLAEQEEDGWSSPLISKLNSIRIFLANIEQFMYQQDIIYQKNEE